MLLPGKSNSYLVWIIIWVNQETKSKVRVQRGIDAASDNKSHQQTENPAQARFINVLVCDVWELLGGLFNGFSSYMQDKRANLMKLVTNMSRSFSTPKSKEPYFIWVKIIHCNTKDTLYIILPLTHADVNEKYFKKHTHFFHLPHWTVCVWIKVYMCVCVYWCKINTNVCSFTHIIFIKQYKNTTYILMCYRSWKLTKSIY